MFSRLKRRSVTGLFKRRNPSMGLKMQQKPIDRFLEIRRRALSNSSFRPAAAGARPKEPRGLFPHALIVQGLLIRQIFVGIGLMSSATIVVNLAM